MANNGYGPTYTPTPPPAHASLSYHPAHVPSSLSRYVEMSVLKMPTWLCEQESARLAGLRECETTNIFVWATAQQFIPHPARPNNSARMSASLPHSARVPLPKMARRPLQRTRCGRKLLADPDGLIEQFACIVGMWYQVKNCIMTLMHVTLGPEI